MRIFSASIVLAFLTYLYLMPSTGSHSTAATNSAMVLAGAIAVLGALFGVLSHE